MTLPGASPITLKFGAKVECLKMFYPDILFVFRNPLVKDCSNKTESVCRTEYESECETRQEEHEVSMHVWDTCHNFNLWRA